METIKLKAEIRDVVGGSSAKKVRKEGNIPAIVYGNEMEPMPIKVEKGEFLHALHTSAGENVIINLELDDKSKNQTVIVKDYEMDYVTDQVDHVDFFAISMDEMIEVEIPLNIKGEPIGADKGGILEIVRPAVAVSCKPADIPEKIDVDVTNIDINESIHAKDINFPAGVDCMEDDDEVFVVVSAHKEVSEETEEEEAMTEPEVIKQKSTEE